MQQPVAGPCYSSYYQLLSTWSWSWSWSSSSECISCIITINPTVFAFYNYFANFLLYLRLFTLEQTLAPSQLQRHHHAAASGTLSSALSLPFPASFIKVEFCRILQQELQCSCYMVIQSRHRLLLKTTNFLLKYFPGLNNYADAI